MILNNYMKTRKDRLDYFRKMKGLKYGDLIDDETIVTADNLRVTASRENDKLDYYLSLIAKKHNISEQWLTKGLGEMDDVIKENKIPLSNIKLIEKEHFKVVTIIPAKAQLGLQGTMYKEDFIGKLETKVIETEDNWQGRYFDIESTGESMINEDDPELSIYDGDELRVREIPRDLYINNKLHINEWKEFTFFHYDRGIFTKNILEHNVSERKVLVHSYNKNKDEFPDEWIDLNDCYIICNVISVTRPRGIKKRLQKLNGTNRH